LTSEGRPVGIEVSKALQEVLKDRFGIRPTFILVAPFTDFSKELAIAAQSDAGGFATAGSQDGEKLPSLLQGRMDGSVFVSRIHELVRRINLRSRIAYGLNVALRLRCLVMSAACLCPIYRSWQSLEMMGSGSFLRPPNIPLS
jgi:hypothetical protein